MIDQVLDSLKATNLKVSPAHAAAALGSGSRAGRGTPPVRRPAGLGLGVGIQGAFALDDQVHVSGLSIRASGNRSTREEIRHVLRPVSTAAIGDLEAFRAVVPDERINPGMAIERSRDVGLEPIVARGQVEFRPFWFR